MRSLPLVLALVLAPLGSACVVGEAADDVPGDDAPTPTGQISGRITANQTWTGTVTLVADATIAAGVTVTIAAGARFEAKLGTTLRVEGVLVADGTAAAPVTMTPTTDALTWAGVVVDPGGSATLRYAAGSDVATLMYCHAGADGCVLDHVTFTDLSRALVAEDTASIIGSHLSRVDNGGVTVSNGDVTIRDSYILTSTGDVIIQNGGSLLIEYAEIGEAMGSYEHCDLHINGATALGINHSNIRAAVYGMMIGGTSGAVMQYNNFVENDLAKDVAEVGVNTAVDLRFNYWDHGAPTALGAAYDVSMASPTRLADAGPRVGR